jgi:GntR family transcriptional regulator, rspAB operon transcriptional repressor
MTVVAYKNSSFKVDRKLPLREQIYTMVRKLILTGTIKPGEGIDEKAMAAHLKVSRTPVREALKKLSDENLVEVVAQSGTKAAAIDRKEIEQAFLIRRALENESAAQAAKHVSAPHIDHLSEILRQHARAIESRNYVLAIGHDDRFHRYLTEMSDLPQLWRSIEISKAQLDRCRHLMLPRTGEAEATLEQHRAIIRGLNTGNPEIARASMASHLEATFKNTMRALEAGEIGADDFASEKTSLK